MGSRVIRSQTSLHCPLTSTSWVGVPFGGEQENGRTVRLCPSLGKTTTVVVYFAHASPWLSYYIYNQTFVGFCAPFSKCRSRIEATHLSPKNIKINN